MGATSTQGLAVLLFLVAFTFLAGALFGDGNLLFMLLFLVGLAGSVVLFLKAKALDHMEQ